MLFRRRYEKMLCAEHELQDVVSKPVDDDDNFVSDCVSCSAQVKKFVCFKIILFPIGNFFFSRVVKSLSHFGWKARRMSCWTRTGRYPLEIPLC